MDFLKKAEGALKGSSQSNAEQSTSTNTNTNQQDDYLDKGLAAAESKFGYGGKISRGTNEKITDGAREEFEKLTGKKVPEKFSN